MRAKRSCCLFCLSVLLAAGTSLAGAPAKQEVLLSAEGLFHSREWHHCASHASSALSLGTEEGFLVNTAPEGTPYEQVRRMEKGMGLSIYGLKEPLPEQYEVSGVFRVDQAAAVGLFSTPAAGRCLADHYLVLLYHGASTCGNIPIPARGETMASHEVGMALAAPEVGYGLQPRDNHRRNTAPSAAWATSFPSGWMGRTVLGVTDAAPLPPGVLGIWLGEGLRRCSPGDHPKVEKPAQSLSRWSSTG